MAITWQTPGAAAYSATGGGGTTVAPAYPTGSAQNDKLLLFVGMKPSTANGGTVTTPSGWNLVTSIIGAGGYGTTLGADTGNTNLFVYERTVPAGGLTGTLTVTVATNNICWAFMARATATSAQWEAVVGTTGSDITAGNVSVTFAADPGVTAGDLIVAAMCIPTDVTTPGQFSAEAFTQTGVTFGTVTEINEPDNTGGNDIGGFSCYSIVSSGTASGVPTLTATAGGTTTNVRGPAVFIRVRETPLAAVTGDLSSTETGSDTFAADGGPAIVGSLSASETGSDSFAASGDVIVTGTVVPAETGSDSFSSTGDVIVQGSLAVAETTIDSFASIGNVIVAGDLTVSEVGSDTLVADGNVIISGNIAVSEAGADSFSASGLVIDPMLVKVSWVVFETPYSGAILGDLAATESETDNFTATGSVIVAGDLVVTETGQDTIAVSGQVIVTGSLASQETSSDSFSSSGKVYISGNLASVEATTDSFNSSGKVYIAGSASITETTTDTFSSEGDTFISGSLATTEVGSDTVSLSGKVYIIGSAAATETNIDLLTGEFYVDGGYVENGYVNEPPRGDVLVQGTITASEIATDIFASTGIVYFPVEAKVSWVSFEFPEPVINGSVNAVETTNDSLASSGKVLVVGSSAVTEAGSDGIVVSGRVVVTGSASVSEIGLDQIVSDGKIFVNGTLTSVEVGSDTAAITGSVVFQDIIGTLAATELTSDSYSSYPAWIEDIGPRTLSLRKDTLSFTGSAQDDLSFLAEKDSLAIEVFSKYS